jgi:decaprenyl-phosphate phosphoribosyltransferase
MVSQQPTNGKYEMRSTSTDRHEKVLAPLLGLLASMRPRQWVKNLFVLAPMFFSKEILVLESALLSVWTAFLFSLAAGTIYILNDILDLEHDRNHPLKSLRPIASGAVSQSFAAGAGLIIGAISIGLGLLVNWRVGLVLTLYMCMNFAYSKGLKNLVMIDVTIIATGFLLRVLSGAFAIDVYVSEWILICTFFLALYLGLGKRRHEWILWSKGLFTGSRSVLEKYDRQRLEFMMVFVGGITISAYSFYTLSASLPGQPLRAASTPFHEAYLPLTVPFTIFGIARFFVLSSSESLKSPTELIIRDGPFVANLVLWVITLGCLEFL